MTDVIETLLNKNLGKVNVTATLVADYDPDLSWIGEYSNEPSSIAIETGRSGNHYPYFNPANADYAKEEFKHMEAYNRDEWMMTGVCVTIKADGRVLGDASLWGIEYAYTVEDYHRETMRDMFLCAMEDARTYLASIPKSKREQRLEGALEKAIESLKSSPCSFWACEGWDEPENMITCSKCWTIHDMLQALASDTPEKVSA